MSKKMRSGIGNWTHADCLWSCLGSYAEASHEMKTETICFIFDYVLQQRNSNGGQFAGHSGDRHSSKGHQDIVHFVWVCVCAMCLAGLLEDRSAFSAWLCSLISSRRRHFPCRASHLTGPAQRSLGPPAPAIEPPPPALPPRLKCVACFSLSLHEKG